MRFVLMLVVAGVQVALAQPPAGKIEATRLFEGTLIVRGDKAAPVRVATYRWVIRERHRVPALEVPLRGVAVVQVRAGSLSTVIGAERRLRRTGDFFTIPAGVSWGLETEGDTAILEAVVVAE